MGYKESWSHCASQGEGGLSSFKIYVNDVEKSIKSPDSFNTMMIVGKKKTLLGPKYYEYVDWSENEYTISIVKPFYKYSLLFNISRRSRITDVKTTSNGKKIVIAYEDGAIAIYSILKREFFQNSERNNSNFMGFFRSSPEKKNIEKDLLNEKPSDVIFPIIKQFTGDDKITDFFVNYSYPGIQNKKEKMKTIYVLKFRSIENHIHNKITLIELCPPFSLLIAIDSKNTVNLFEFNKHEIIKRIKFNEIFKIREKITKISICESSGDFICSTKSMVVLFNINGVILGTLNLNNFKISSEITYSIIKSLRSTQSESYLFTGHSDGSLRMWRLNLNPKIENSFRKFSFGETNIFDTHIIDSYRFNYNTEYYRSNIRQDYEFSFIFSEPFELIGKSKLPVLLIKLSEDASNLIVIHEDNTLYSWNYLDNLIKKYKSKNEKECDQCRANLNSKLDCSNCTKRICEGCKLLEIVPEISLKSESPLCYNCISSISSANKMLYDFA